MRPLGFPPPSFAQAGTSRLRLARAHLTLVVGILGGEAAPSMPVSPRLHAVTP